VNFETVCVIYHLSTTIITINNITFHTNAVQAAVLYICGSTNIFVGGRLRFSCERSRKAHVLIAVNAVSSRFSRYICGFLRFSALVLPHRC